MREGAWVGRAPDGPGNGRHVEEWGCWRLERRGEPLCCAADSPSSDPARGGEPRPVSLVRGRRSVYPPPPPAPARPPARPQASPHRRRGSARGEHLLPLVARLLPFPVTRRALARPPHRARSARLLAAAAARPAPPRLPPLLTRTPRRRRSGTDGAATALSGRCSAPPSRAPRARCAAAAAPPSPSVSRRMVCGARTRGTRSAHGLVG